MKDKKIQYKISLGYVGCYNRGTMTVPGDITEEELDELMLERVYEYIELSVDPEGDNLYSVYLTNGYGSRACHSDTIEADDEDEAEQYAWEWAWNYIDYGYEEVV